MELEEDELDVSQMSMTKSRSENRSKMWVSVREAREPLPRLMMLCEVGEGGGGGGDGERRLFGGGGDKLLFGGGGDKLLLGGGGDRRLLGCKTSPASMPGPMPGTFEWPSPPGSRR
jgi:hypothetical protein